MKELEIIWKIKENRFSNGSIAKCHKYTLGSIDWVGGDLPYRATSFLPGLKQNLGSFKTEEDAKKRVEFASNFWINELNIKF